jgi:APA family basic amino acid/polyamine antiporter
VDGTCILAAHSAEYGGFLVGCIDWIAQPVAVAYPAVAFSDFAAELQTSLHGCAKLVSVASVIILTVLNWLGLRAASRIQELTSLIKALALIAFVVACFVISRIVLPMELLCLRAWPPPKEGFS